MFGRLRDIIHLLVITYLVQGPCAGCSERVSNHAAMLKREGLEDDPPNWAVSQKFQGFPACIHLGMG